MTYASLQDAVQQAAHLQVKTLQRHDVWRFDDGTFEVVPYTVGPYLGSISVVETELLGATSMKKPITFNLPLVKKTSKYLGVSAVGEGEVAWLGLVALSDVIFHPHAIEAGPKGVVEFTCEHAYAVKKGLPISAGVPVFEPKTDVKLTAVVGADFAEIEKKILTQLVNSHQNKYLVTAEEAAEAVLGAHSVPGGHLLPLDPAALAVQLKGHGKEAKEVVFDPEGFAIIDPGVGEPVTVSKTWVGEKVCEITLPLVEDTNAYLGLSVLGKTVFWKKSSLVAFDVGEITATIKAPIALLKKKKLMHLVPGH